MGMNVGRTRARRKLLVGDSSTLCRHPFFGKLLAYVKGAGGYSTAHEMGKQVLIGYEQWLLYTKFRTCSLPQIALKSKNPMKAMCRIR